MRAGNFLITTIVWLAATSGIAHAETGAVVVHGTAKDHERAVVASAIDATLRDAAWSVVDASFSQKEIDTILVCMGHERPWSCLIETLSAKGVQRLAIVKVTTEAKGKGKAISLFGEVVIGDAVPSNEFYYCEPCDDTALAESAKTLTRTLLERSTASEGTTAIEVHTVPTGASIVVDGSMAGSSDKTIPVSMGVHQVQLQRSGYRPESRPVTVKEGETVKLAIVLVPAEGGSTPVVPVDKPSHLVPGLIAGAGVLALVGGIVYSLEVDPPAINDGKQPTYLYSGPAIVVASVGAIAIGVGVYLWFHHPKSRSTPTLSVVRGGGAVGWSTSF